MATSYPPFYEPLLLHCLRYLAFGFFWFLFFFPGFRVSGFGEIWVIFVFDKTDGTDGRMRAGLPGWWMGWGGGDRMAQILFSIYLLLHIRFVPSVSLLIAPYFSNYILTYTIIIISMPGARSNLPGRLKSRKAAPPSGGWETKRLIKHIPIQPIIHPSIHPPIHPAQWQPTGGYILLFFGGGFPAQDGLRGRVVHAAAAAVATAEINDPPPLPGDLDVSGSDGGTNRCSLPCPPSAA